MIETGAFYAAVAGSSAAIFGVGAGFLATRIVALAERAAVLDIEVGDAMNRSINREEGLQARWAENARRDALADLHATIKELWKAVGVPLGSAIVLVWLSLLPLVGWIEDTDTYRFALLCLFAIGALLWMRLLDRLAGAIVEFTRSEAETRQKKRDEMTAEGEPFILSGDPTALANAGKRLAELLPEKVRKKRSVLKWIKQLGKDWRPRV